MTDPERMIDTAGSPEARLLASALEEPPPPDLLARTLAAATSLAPIAGAGAAAGAGAGAGAAAGGGILGSAALGALAGVLVVAGYGLIAGRDEGHPPKSAPAAISASVPREAPPPEREAQPSPASSPSLVAPPSPPSSAAHPTVLAAEIELLDEASRALHVGNPARAQALLDRYAREIPHGQLVREAAKLRAEVLASLRDGGDPERTIP